MKANLPQIETDILTALLDFKPRNQNQIADIIGNRKNSTDRVHVHRALRTLRPFLTQHLPGFDEMGIKLSIKEDIEIIEQINQKYPSLTPHLQKNDKIIEMLIKKQFWLIDLKPWGINVDSCKQFCYACLKYHDVYPPLCGCGEERLRGCVEEASKITVKEEEEYWKGRIELIQSELITKFEKRLKASPYFFRTCLKNSPEDLRRLLFKLTPLRGITFEMRPLGLWACGKMGIASKEPEACISEVFDRLFEISVTQDIMNKEASEEAIEDVLEMKERERKYFEYLRNRDQIPDEANEVKIDLRTAINEPIKTEEA